MEPTCVFMIDGAPPIFNFNLDEGYELMCKNAEPARSSAEWMAAFFPDKVKMKGKNQLGDHIYERWSNGTRIAADFFTSAQDCFHVFHCPLFAVVGGLYLS